LQVAENVDALYLLYYFRTELFLDQIRKYRTGAAIPAISDDDLLRVKVLLPSGDHQKRISELMKKTLLLREQASKVMTELSQEFAKLTESLFVPTEQS